MATEFWPKDSDTLLDWQRYAVIMRPDGVEKGGAVSLLGGRWVQLPFTRGWCGGMGFENPSDRNFQSNPNDSVYPRYDRLISRTLMPGATVDVAILPGEASPTPAAPGLTRNLGDVWEYGIAYWIVPPKNAASPNLYGLVLDGLDPALDPLAAYAGRPIFKDVAQRNADYIGAGLGAMKENMRCNVDGVDYIYKGGGWQVEFPPYGPRVVADLAAAVGLPEATFLYVNGRDKPGIITPGGPTMTMVGAVRQRKPEDYNAGGVNLTASWSHTWGIDVLQHSLVAFSVDPVIKTSGNAGGTMTLTITGGDPAPDPIVWNSHTLATLVTKSLRDWVRAPGDMPITATLTITLDAGSTACTLHEIPSMFVELS